MSDVEVDVVIVGAGPTGLMLAVCLARLGVSFVILDRKDGPTRESRAVVIQARSLEIYDQLGLADRVLAQATVVNAVRPGFESRPFSTVNLRALGEGITPFPHLYTLEQSKNERILCERLTELGHEVLWRHEVESWEESAEGGILSALTGEESLTISARWCVGADGSGSRVRQLSGIDFEGSTSEQTFFVIDAAGVSGIPLDVVNVRFGERHFLLSFPMGAPDHERLIGVVPQSDDPRSAVRGILTDTFGVGYRDENWFSTYRVHHRVARHFRKGAVFLAGDAAHVHSPVGGQGMNTGLQDAHNLACKFADVVAGSADDSYLDRFEAERRPVALRLVSTTDRIFGLVTSPGVIARFARRRVLRFMAPLAARIVPKLRGSSRAFEYLSQTRIHYWMTNPRARRGRVVGRRVPFNGDNFEILRTFKWHVQAFGDVSSDLDALALPIARFADARTPALRNGMLYLVRPDGFVAAEASPADAAGVFAEALRH